MHSDTNPRVAPEAPVISSTLTFESHGRTVRLQAFVPEGGVRLPTVLALHGASGMDSGHRYVRTVAEAWAAQGFATLLVHYFDSTGTTYASETAIYRDFERWLATIGDAIECAARQPFADPARIALVGYSLGGYLAVARAAHDERVRAVVEIAGGIDATFAKSVQRLPPLLLIHGEEDRRVPFARALELKALAERCQTPHATRFYPGETHYLSPGAALDALEAGVEFLRQRLSSVA